MSLGLLTILLVRVVVSVKKLSNLETFGSMMVRLQRFLTLLALYIMWVFVVLRVCADLFGLSPRFLQMAMECVWLLRLPLSR